MTTANMRKNPETGFGNIQLDSALTQALSDMQFAEPTPIQKYAIPFALQGRDILGSAQTGTGKTAAFSIPLVQHLMSNESSVALVLSPTRELAQQIFKTIAELLKYTRGVNTAVLIGGEAMGKQFAQLNRRPRVIVATPGRLNDHLERGSVKLDQADFLVLDETDRMLDMGFSIQLERIFQYLPEKRQTLMFSATLPQSIMALANQYLDNPERVAIAPTRTIANNLQQDVLRVGDAEKFDTLVEELKSCEGTAIVFAKTKYGTERLAKRLANEGLDTDAIHGDLKQAKRERVIAAFRKGKFRILVATDVVARGLDVPHVAHVVNYDLPQVAEDYVHRIGRTARAGQSGRALCILTSHDNRKWREIQMLIDPERAKAEEGAPGCVKSRKGKTTAFAGKHKKKPFAKDKPFKRGENAGKFGKAEPWTKPSRSAKPSKFGKPAHADRAEKSDQFERGDRAERSDRPVKFTKSDKPFSAKGKKPFTRNGKPSFDKPRGERFERSEGQEQRQDRGQDRRQERGEGQGQGQGQERRFDKKPFKSGGKPAGKPGGKSFSKSGGKPGFSKDKPYGKSEGKPSFSKDKPHGKSEGGKGNFAKKGPKKPFMNKGKPRSKPFKAA